MAATAATAATMKPKRFILTINGGSSSIKFALFDARSGDARALQGSIERIGLGDARWTIATPDPSSRAIEARDHAMAADALVDWLADRIGVDALAAVGHRIVHGGPTHSAPQRLTAELVESLRGLAPYDPDHLPQEIELSERIARRFPDVPQIACFDTAFHHDLPRVARWLPIPRRYFVQGVRTYGFHGLSYAYLMRELDRLGAATGRVLLAHLGSGASLAAVRDGRPIDTSMSFTPISGFPMSTRSGHLDPGVLWYLSRTEGMPMETLFHMLSRESGLLGLSETTSDMRDLLAREATDERAADAIAVFCYQVRKWIGAFTAALGGLDTLVFSGGIGEGSAEIRKRICEGLSFLGLELDAARNAEGAAVISRDDAAVVARVIRTDEERMIAEAARGVIEGTGGIR